MPAVFAHDQPLGSPPCPTSPLAHPLSSAVPTTVAHRHEPILYRRKLIAATVLPKRRPGCSLTSSPFSWIRDQIHHGP
ncbi:hypothetical protein NL676_023845 [Syzygium grande]|nr:hypothetical protein NL676_023845 [Syzygium grande]